MGFFEKIKKGLEKTKNSVIGRVDDVIKSFRTVDEDLLEELEEILIMSDMGVYTVERIIDELRNKVKEGKLKEPEEVKTLLKEILYDIMGKHDFSLKIETTPSIVLVVGVNGVGKTTTIGKLGANLKSQGKKVILAAGDTFRAAAIDQLEIWGKRSDIDVIKHSEGADPAAVVFDSIAAGKARKADVIICDTAGRLHNKTNLMNELNKIFRVTDRDLADASREVLLVLDATTGQNAVTQAKEFSKVCPLTGIVLTKLDGTAKGGVVVSISSELDIPVKYIGVGEGIDDLQPFNCKEFIDALFE
ncbi:MAG: signal recognition particle-docking protein FtsY [Clostridia bacterium]|nr:signal recognition particle-docking protein FtsY [Clostridia bacterium]